MSQWVLGIIKRGYSLQFAQRPLRFSGMVPTSVQSRDAHVLRSEVKNLLAKGAIEMVPPAQSELGFYSRYFLVPKKDGGLRPILDLRRLNHALNRSSRQIRPENLFFSLDLKDAYFHIQIAPHHRRFLRFAFKGVAYQYTVLPFGLSLAPRTFTKCIYAALSPLRQKESAFSITSMTDSFWPSRRRSHYLTEPSSSALRMPGAQGELCQESTVPQPTSFVPGNSV